MADNIPVETGGVLRSVSERGHGWECAVLYLISVSELAARAISKATSWGEHSLAAKRYLREDRMNCLASRSLAEGRGGPLRYCRKYWL